MIILLMLVLAIEIFLRVYPLVSFYWLGVDTFYHLTVARHTRKELRLPKNIPEFLYHGPHAYPPLLHMILALMPHSLSKFVPLACDLANAALVFGLSSFVDSGNLVQGLLAVVLYLSIPINYIDSLSINPRPIGNILLTASIFSLLLCSNQTVPFIFVVLYGLMLLSHKMAVQVSWFVLGGLAISVPVLAGKIAVSVALAIILVTIFTGGFYWKILKQHIGYLRFHVRFGDLSGRKAFPGPVALLRSNPLLLLAAVAVLLTLYHGASVEPIIASWAIMTSLLAVFWRFGDAHRFLAFGSSATAVIAALWCNNSLGPMLCTSALCYGIWRQIDTLRKFAPPFVITHDLLSCFQFIRKQQQTMLLCLPLSYSYSAAYFARQTILAGDASLRGLIKGFDLSRRIRTLQGLQETIRETGVSLVLVDHSIFCGSKDVFDTMGFITVHSAGRYSIFRRPPSG